MDASRRSLLGLVVLVVAVTAASQWWQGHQDRQLGQQVATLARPGDIHMLASETCSACWMARAWFKEHKVTFSECMIETDSACRRTFDQHGQPGTPVMVVRGQPQLGFDPGRLHRALQQRA
jgi:glutaredoxin